MSHVAVELEEGDRAPVEAALRSAGFETVGGKPWARVLKAREGTFEDAEPDVAWVLAGGVLAICGGEGPLLAALNLTPGTAAVEGPVEASAPGAPPIHVERPWPLTGVGYSLYRAGGRCVALAGKRGLGWIAYIGSADPALLVASLSWIASRGVPGAVL